MTGAAACSVVVPAHREGAVIERCLRALLDGPVPLEVVVVVNGSDDDTASRARGVPVPSHSSLVVVELEQAGKALALAEGDRHVAAFPRVYLDADVVCTNEAVGTTARRLRGDGPPDAAAPRLTYDLTGVPWLVAAYTRVWLALHRTPWLVGSGVYALSAAGRRRVGTFPRAIADDAWVRSRFAPGEREVVDADFVAFPPRRSVDLVRRKSRVFLGHLELERTGVVLDFEHNCSLGELARRSDRPPLPELVAYAVITVVAKLRARVQLLLERTDTWERDESSRVPS